MGNEQSNRVPGFITVHYHDTMGGIASGEEVVLNVSHIVNYDNTAIYTTTQGITVRESISEINSLIQQSIQDKIEFDCQVRRIDGLGGYNDRNHYK